MDDDGAYFACCRRRSIACAICSCSSVLARRAEAANPKASKSFKGIERFHCDRVLDLAIARDAPIGRKTKNGQPGDYIVEAADYDQVKTALAAIVREGIQSTDFCHAETMIRQVLQEAGAA
jgi:hypothetical protein